jgi:hypothetical protein
VQQVLEGDDLLLIVRFVVRSRRGLAPCKGSEPMHGVRATSKASAEASKLSDLRPQLFGVSRSSILTMGSTFAGSPAQQACDDYGRITWPSIRAEL